MKNINIIFLLGILIFLGCKDSDRDKDTSVNSSAAYGAGQSYTYNVIKLIHQAALSSKGITANNLSNSTSIFGCDTLIVDTTSSPMQITIKFNGICSENGNTRQGEIIATFNGKYNNLGTITSINFNNYYFNDYLVKGSISYNFQGIISGNPTYGISISNFSIENNKNRTLKFSANQKLIVKSGETTATYSDDSYSITGNATGRAFEGNDFSAIIDDPLTLNGNCNWISSGEATVTPENKQPRKLNFGYSCDNKATAQIYGLSFEVIFP